MKFGAARTWSVSGRQLGVAKFKIHKYYSSTYWHLVYGYPVESHLLEQKRKKGRKPRGPAPWCLKDNIRHDPNNR